MSILDSRGILQRIFSPAQQGRGGDHHLKFPQLKFQGQTPQRPFSQGNVVPLQPALHQTGDTVFFGQNASRTGRKRRPAGRSDGRVYSPRLPFDAKFFEHLKDLVLKTKDKRDSFPLALAKYIERFMPQYQEKKPEKVILDSVIAEVTGSHNGAPVKTKVKSLLGGEQIFTEWLDMLEKTEQYAQISLYDFEHMTVEGGREVHGAEREMGWHLQQKVLPKIVEKAKQGVKFQIILDNSKEPKYDEWGYLQREQGTNNNEEMIKHLQQLNEEIKKVTGKDQIEILAYPRELGRIYHVKALISDGKRAIVGGMNLSNHSAANWDACVSLEGAEVANLQAETFHQDWVVSKYWNQHFYNDTRGLKYPLKTIKRMLPNLEHLDVDKAAVQAIKDSLPQIQPVSDPAIQVLNTMPREYKYFGFTPREDLETFFRATLADDRLKGIVAEQFVSSHKELCPIFIDLVKEKGVEFKKLHSADVTNKFPYVRQTPYTLKEEGLDLRFYDEWEAIQERLHAKWTLFQLQSEGRKGTTDDALVIGSANTSQAAFQTNTVSGRRRGNRDMAIVIRNNEIGKVFREQFKIDWTFSKEEKPSGLGMAMLTDAEKLREDTLEDLMAAFSKGGFAVPPGLTEAKKQKKESA